jgi:REP-associated tyrosine transposase
LKDEAMPYSDLLRGRASIGGQIYIVTTVARNRARLFGDLHLGRIVVRALHYEATALRASTLAYVVMPDHLHWLVQLHPGHNLSTVVRSVKGRSAFEIGRVRGSRGQVWEVGFHDHAVRREEDLQDVARYVVRNRIRAGLVRSVYEYSLWDAVWMHQKSG